MSKHNILSIKRVKRGNQLVFKSQGDFAIYNEFVKSLDDGQIVEEFLETLHDTGSNAQLAKIHACIRELAKESGNTFNSMKNDIKHHAGISWRTKDGLYSKSFADCSVDELALVIESIIEIGDVIGINFRGHLPNPS